MSANQWSDAALQRSRVVAEISDYVRERFNVRAEDESFSSSSDLWGDGYIDSMGVLDLVVFMDSNFEISILDDDLIAENFQSIESLADLVERCTRTG